MPATYKFDVVAIVTITVTTDAGEDAAREAASALDAISVMAVMDGDFELSREVADGTVYGVTTVAPRGRPYLASAQNIPEPITDGRAVLEAELANAVEALQGDSNDAEHDALYGMAGQVASVLDVEFDPYQDGDE